MLKRFSVKGYRSFRNRVTLDLGNHHDYIWHNDQGSGDVYITNDIISNALLLGGNAMGKTNLGYALMDVKDNFRRNSSRSAFFSEPDSSFLNGDCNKEYAEFEYVFALDESEVSYLYRKDDRQNMLYERLSCNGDFVFERDNVCHLLDSSGFESIGAAGLNWDFADDELSVLGYLSNSLPKTSSPLIFSLRRFIDDMGMISVPMRAERYAMIRSHLRPLVRDRELVRELERFLQKYGVDERLDVVDGPDGNPTLYFNHKRLIEFSQACSGGTLTLLMLFSRFFVRDAGRDASFLYIDEFDAYLHFEVAEQLVSYFGSVAECQTICSTHNTSLVKNQIMRPDCVFAIRLRDAGEGVPAELFITSLADSTNREIRLINNVEHLLRNGEFE